MPTKKIPFQKPPLSIEDQLSLLISRGMIINDRIFAAHHLTYISYYRFCGYAIEFEDNLINEEKRYRSDTTFEQIVDCYIFDRKLRLLVIDAIERIEVAIRTTIINTLSLKYGAHWYLDKSLFLPKFDYNHLIQRVKKETFHEAPIGSRNHTKRERPIQHYYDKYSVPELPPIWMIAEILPLGTWSMMFSNLISRDDQKGISEHFKISYTVMDSWLHTLTYLRNLCAHHIKLWNRHFKLKPIIAKNYAHLLENNHLFSAQAAILKIFLNTISPGSSWGEHLQALIADHPNIDIKKMGFTSDWYKDTLWSTDATLQ